MLHLDKYFCAPQFYTPAWFWLILCSMYVVCFCFSLCIFFILVWAMGCVLHNLRNQFLSLCSACVVVFYLFVILFLLTHFQRFLISASSHRVRFFSQATWWAPKFACKLFALIFSTLIYWPWFKVRLITSRRLQHFESNVGCL